MHTQGDVTCPAGRSRHRQSAQHQGPDQGPDGGVSERAGVHEAETEGPTMIAAIYARLNTKAIDRTLQAQADRFSVLQAAPVPLVVRPWRKEHWHNWLSVRRSGRVAR